METFHTSCCKPLNLIVDTCGRGFDIKRIPRERAFDRFFVRLVCSDGNESASCECHRHGRHFLPTGNVPDGTYSLEVYNLTNEQREKPTFIKYIGNYVYMVENNFDNTYRIIGKKKIK